LSRPKRRHFSLLLAWGFLRGAPGGHRFLTCRELLVLQGFPGDTPMPSTYSLACRLLGRAIPPPMAATALWAPAVLLGPLEQGPAGLDRLLNELCSRAVRPSADGSGGSRGRGPCPRGPGGANPRPGGGRQRQSGPWRQSGAGHAHDDLVDRILSFICPAWPEVRFGVDKKRQLGTLLRRASCAAEDPFALGDTQAAPRGGWAFDPGSGQAGRMGAQEEQSARTSAGGPGHRAHGGPSGASVGTRSRGAGATGVLMAAAAAAFGLRGVDSAHTISGGWSDPWWTPAFDPTLGYEGEGPGGRITVATVNPTSWNAQAHNWL